MTFFAWETGQAYPPFTKAEILADFLHIPFGYLFLKQPPASEIPLPDLRTVRGKPNKPSIDFLAVLYSVLLKQEWYREYAKEHGMKKLSFVSSLSQNDEVERVATEIRNALAANSDLREGVKSWSAYLSLLCAQAEALGVLVMRSGLVGNDTRRKLSADEFQGFAITDPLAPVVFINGQDFQRAQVFTLAHELAHLWIGQSGVCAFEEAPVNKPQPGLEDFCDAVAAEVLVPKSEFINAWDANPSVERLARNYWVSTFVVLRRAYETNKITRAEFFQRRKQEAERRRGAKRGGVGKYYESVVNRHSRRLTRAVIRDVSEGGTVFRDAARLLDLKVSTFSKFMERA